MKKLIIFGAALAAVFACQKNEMPIQNRMVTITAEAGAASKTTMGEKTEGTYPMSWSAEEHFYLREIAVPATGKETVSHYGSSSFTKNDAHTGTIVFDVAAQSVTGTYDYVSVYPCHPTNCKTNLPNGVRYAGGDDLKNRCSYALSNTRPQVPTATAPDDSTHLMVAFDLGKDAQATSINLAFKSVVSYGKMTLKNFPALGADETVSQIQISAASDKKMSGRVYHYFHDATTGQKAGDIVPFSSTAVYNYVLIDPRNISFNTTGFDIWFTTFPIDLAQNDTLSFQVTTNKGNYEFSKILGKAIDFKAGKVSEFTVDYDKCITPFKTLTFDFSTCPKDWPTGSESWKSTDIKPVTMPYVLGDKTYNFIGQPCTDATSRGFAWGWNSVAAVEFFVFNTQRFFGLPAIEGYKLVTVKFIQAMTTNTKRKAGITAAVSAQKKQEYVAGGEAKAVGSNGAVYTFNLTDSVVNKVYYIAATDASTGIATLTLTYQKVDQ